MCDKLSYKTLDMLAGTRRPGLLAADASRLKLVLRIRRQPLGEPVAALDDDTILLQLHQLAEVELGGGWFAIEQGARLFPGTRTCR